MHRPEAIKPPAGADTAPLRKSASQKVRGGSVKGTKIFGKWQDRVVSGKKPPV